MSETRRRPLLLEALSKHAAAFLKKDRDLSFYGPNACKQKYVP